MPVISIRVSAAEKKWLLEMAKFNGLSVSKLLKTHSYEQLQDQYDSLIGEDRYMNFIKKGKKGYTLSQLNTVLDKKMNSK